jgi:hypothetical protein
MTHPDCCSSEVLLRAPSRFRSSRISSFSAFVLASLALLALAAPRAQAQTFGAYHPDGQIIMPGAGALFDSLPDGRLVALVGSTVYRETSAAARSFTPLGTLPAGGDIPSFGAAFLRVSPNGQTIAVGNNGGATFSNFLVGVFAFPALTGTWFSAGHFDAAWVDNRYLALSSGTFGSPSVVNALDTTSPNPALPVLLSLVQNIGGASSGIAFDPAGNLYTANGFQGTGPSTTGAVRAVGHAAVAAALAGGPPTDFENQGIPIIDLLSGSPLAFDSAGDLVVGGGSSFSTPVDDNYFALVSASAVAAALAGGGSINVADTTKVHKLDPDPGADSFYYVNCNRARLELYAVNSGSATAFVYTTSAPVPATSPWSLVACATLLLYVGIRRLRAET